jgi:hypothetical protein
VPALAAVAQSGGPRAAIAEPIVDVGQVVRGDEISATFEIANRGAAPLEITEVRPACGCTVADYDKTIAPGATGRIQATVDTENILGPNSKGITVFTNDPQNPRLQLTVKSNVKPFLYLDPGYARFSQFVQSGGAQTISQTLWAEDYEDLKIVAVESGSPHIEVAYREAREGERDTAGVGRQWRIDVTLAGNSPLGPLSDRVVVTTNHPRQRVTDIPVSAFVRPMVSVTPPAIDFGPIEVGSDQQWGVLVRNFGDTPLELGAVEAMDGVTVDVEKVDDEGRQWKLVVTPTRNLPRGAFTGQVRVATNLPEMGEIVVDLEGEGR